MTEDQTVYIVLYSDWNDKWVEAVFTTEQAAEDYIDGEKLRYPRACYHIDEMPLQS